MFEWTTQNSPHRRLRRLLSLLLPNAIPASVGRPKLPTSPEVSCCESIEYPRDSVPNSKIQEGQWFDFAEQCIWRCCAHHVRCLQCHHNPQMVPSLPTPLVLPPANPTGL